MSKTKTEAQRLAALLDHGNDTSQIEREVIDELRRLDAAHTVAVELAAQYAAERDQLRAQLDQAVQQYKEDAERYRWLRDDTDSDWAICEWSHDPGDEGYYRDARAPHIVDAAIDAAMEKGVK